MKNKLNFNEIRASYLSGYNITSILKKQLGFDDNTPEIIEAAYDIQAGSYIDYVEKNYSKVLSYTREMGDILNKHLVQKDTLLDVGTGEITTLTLLTKFLTNSNLKIYCFDISWSRLYVGLKFAEKNMDPLLFNKLNIFCADILKIPMQDKSIDVITSSHALEPNGGNLEQIMLELFRVAKNKLILFEPSFEDNSPEGKERMIQLGYIKDLPGVIQKLGGKLQDKIKMNNISNDLNPTYAFIIEPPPCSITKSAVTDSEVPPYSDPGTDNKLTMTNNFYYSKHSALAYPILEGVPILKLSNGVLASALLNV